MRAETITCLRNSGAECRERRDNAILARPDRTKVGPGTGDETATDVHAAIEPTTWTEHLCRVREAHCVSLRDSEFAPLSFSEHKHRREKIVVTFHDGNRLQFVYRMYPCRANFRFSD